MKKNLLIFCFIASRLAAYAQPYGNEWITDYSKTYYKINVSNDGFYRIASGTLTAAGINPNTIAKDFALYHNGQQVPLYISANSNSALSGSDYIEFYGEKNRGYLDSLLYRSAYYQINPEYSLFTDVSVYYLVINTASSNARFVEVGNFGSGNPEPYYMHKVIAPLTLDYFPGKYFPAFPDEIFKSIYDEGEGYAANNWFNNNSAQSYTVSTPNVNMQAPVNATLKTYFANYSNEGTKFHQAQISLNGTPVYTQPGQISGYQLNKAQISLTPSQLISGNNSVSYIDLGNCNSQHQNKLGYIEIEYPRNFDFENKKQFYFNIAGSGSGKRLAITNFDDDGTQPVLYDLTNRLIYRSTQAPGTFPLNYNLFASAGTREMYLRANSPNTYTVVSQLTPVTFTDLSDIAQQGEYVIITAGKLRDDGTGFDPVDEYRQYRDRDLTPGDGKYFQCRILDIETLYDQFGYGIRKSPLAIRNFINYVKAAWAVSPKHVFLIGKGRESPSIRSGGSAYNQCLIPTFGYPGSDNLLASSRNSDVAQVAIGRLAAENANQVKDYLDKVKLYEDQQNTYVNDQAIPPKDWQKKILHFSGGTSSYEQGNFRAHVDDYARTAKDTSWGAQTTTYSKTSTNPIDESLSQIIKGKINEGVSWITFFGHSATAAFDFSIDEPENYTNSPKFPVILSNGCFSGFIHDATPGYSDRFVLLPNKGAIAFLATTGLSLETGLHNFSDSLYKDFCNSTYLKPLGISMQQTYNSIVCCNTDNDDLSVAYEMTLHGDPGLVLNQYPKPDYAIDQTSVFFNPSSVQPGIDSFEVNVIVTNIGKAIRDSIAVTVNRTFFDANGNQQSSFYRKDIPAPYYKDTVAFKMPVLVENLGYGQNLFNPYVEADFRIDEMAEGNNGLLAPVSIQIQNDDIIPVYPYEFAIVPNRGVTLKASTVNPFAPARNYKFEIDTSELFTTATGAHHQEAVIFHAGGVVTWTPTIPYAEDGMVYYWRVRKDSAGAEWHYSSFIYLDGEYPGWNQSHYFQWLKDNYLNVNLDADRIFKFPPTVNNIHVLTGNGWADNPHFSLLGWDYNNANMYRWRMGGCGFWHGITFAVIDPVTGQNWISNNSNFPRDDFGDKFGNYSCANKDINQNGFDFATTGTHPSALFGNQPWSQLIQNFIDSIPANFYVLIYSTNTPTYTQWDNTLVQALQSIGFQQASDFQNGTFNGPFVFFSQKGNSGSTQFFSSPQNNFNTPLSADINFNASWNQGQFTSPKIGPAFEWGSVHWRHQPFETPDNDADTVDIIGVDNNGFETVLVSMIKLDTIFNGSINATTYPYLRLRLRTKDDVSRTPTQLIYWRVLFKKPPEAAINPSAHFVFNPSVNIGDSLHLEIGLENVTDIHMDSMLTKYTIRDAQLSNHVSYIRYDSLRALNIMHLVFKSPLNGNYYEGLNKIIIEANPDNDQLEQYHFNNFAEIDFTGIADKINPLLDVTFDGVHILSGDIVSARPNILIMLKDENKFLALDDESLLDVYLKYPGEANPRKFNYDNSILTFYPADAQNLARQNKAHAEFKPGLLPDGIYELIIKDHDRSGNNSSSDDNKLVGNTYFDYKIAFEVINKPMITNVLNYPNPFTTSTKFVFTITGSEVPDIMKIQILTIKGTVVKEIMKDELGDLHVGRNITSYTWDGRDQYGDLLANGVYFYRVVARLDDKRMDHMSQSYDKYFKHGFGKMVLVR